MHCKSGRTGNREGGREGMGSVVHWYTYTGAQTRTTTIKHAGTPDVCKCMWLSVLCQCILNTVLLPRIGDH